jgi:hypothetical protein
MSIIGNSNNYSISNHAFGVNTIEVLLTAESCSKANLCEISLLINKPIEKYRYLVTLISFYIIIFIYKNTEI